MARTRSVADQLVGQLVAAGVRHVYGMVGDSLNPVVDAMRRTNGIEWVQLRHFTTAMSKEILGGGMGEVMAIARSSLRNVPRP